MLGESVGRIQHVGMGERWKDLACVGVVVPAFNMCQLVFLLMQINDRGWG
jgi:hypothetical protein